MEKQEKQYERDPNFIYRKIVDESVLVPIHHDVADMDCIYTLNELGSFLWEFLEKPATQAELQTAVLDQYDADTSSLQTDLERFLEEMISIGALRKA